MTTPPKALVATSRSLFEVDLEAGERRVVDEGHGLYFGVTWDRQRYYIAARWYPPLTPTSHIERPRLLVFDADLRLVEKRRFPLETGGLHQIFFHERYDGGELYCSCSREDRYVIGLGESWRAFYPSPDPTHHDRDTHHFNSVWIEEGEEHDTLFLLGHNNGPSDVWEFRWKGGFDDRSDGLELVRKVRAGETAHNVWREPDGELAICNSSGGVVQTVGGRVLARTGGFPRGAAIGRERSVIGISSIANRSNRWWSHGSLHVYDKAWKLVREIDLGRCGQVNEIRLLGEDSAHHRLLPPGRS